MAELFPIKDLNKKQVIDATRVGAVPGDICVVVRITETPTRAVLAQLAALPDLQMLLSNVLTAYPPELCALERLQVLHLDGCPLTTLPEEIGGLRALKVLNLGSCPKLTTLPAGIAGLESLTKLDLRHGGIARIPPEIGQLKKLKSVDLFGCDIPPSAVTKHAPKVKVNK